ncbi:hypothetical protein ElyMa_004289400 [Elysia marginata]|uniref:Uncharacterized protein n=1 Tax=Elysia marginata TaxID=1093978 RepID=A0AAV4GWF0_9GAST|nr:hypothetical protein ElyMa_004289400 [Elysia marginata]
MAQSSDDDGGSDTDDDGGGDTDDDGGNDTDDDGGGDTDDQDDGDDSGPPLGSISEPELQERATLQVQGFRAPRPMCDQRLETTHTHTGLYQDKSPNEIFSSLTHLCLNFVYDSIII